MVKIHALPERWLPIAIAPIDADLQVCVMNKTDVHALVFPVRKSGTNWVDAHTKENVDIEPTHWRLWSERPLV